MKGDSSSTYKKRRYSGNIDLRSDTNLNVNNQNITQPQSYTPGYTSSILLNNDSEDTDNDHLYHLETTNPFAISGKQTPFNNSSTKNPLRENPSKQVVNMSDTRNSNMWTQDDNVREYSHSLRNGDSFANTGTFGHSLDDFDTSDAGIARMFEALDVDHDNVLSYDEICKVVEYLSVQKNFSTRQIQLLMNSLNPFESITFQEFKNMLLYHSVERPPLSAGIFEEKDIDDTVQYVLDSYYRHYRLFKFIFTPRPLLFIEQGSMNGINKVDPPPPLSEGILTKSLTVEEEETSVGDEKKNE